MAYFGKKLCPRCSDPLLFKEIANHFISQHKSDGLVQCPFCGVSPLSTGFHAHLETSHKKAKGFLTEAELQERFENDHYSGGLGSGH